jgi:hypothetical protein
VQAIRLTGACLLVRLLCCCLYDAHTRVACASANQPTTDHPIDRQSTVCAIVLGTHLRRGCVCFEPPQVRYDGYIQREAGLDPSLAKASKTHKAKKVDPTRSSEFAADIHLEAYKVHNNLNLN